MGMERRKCSNCGVVCWHNPSPKSERPNGRCTFCGYPAGGNGDSPKKALQQAIMKKQATRATLLHITEV